MSLKLRWIRGHDQLNFDRPDVWFSLGMRGTGKSSLLEHFGMEYYEKDTVILDLFGSRDGEGLAWLRSDFVQKDGAKALILTDENVSVKGSYDVKLAASLTLKDVESYDIIISAAPFYLNFDREFFHAAQVTDLLYKRLHFKRLVYLLCREASNFYYSRLKVSENQTFAKAQMVYLLRESRHMGLALGLDSLRFYSLDIDIRNLTDFLLLKSQGAQGLTKDLKWMYNYVDAGLMRNMKPNQFIILTRRGSIGYGTFPEVAWHKREKEDILNVLDLKVEYGEVLEESILKGSYKTVGDIEHVEIIKLRVEKGLGMVKIAEQLHRSSRTAQVHLKSHNASVSTSGYCPACKRVGSEYQSKIIE
jgi:hypothetical protein